jgi:dihydroceramidase
MIFNYQIELISEAHFGGMGNDPTVLDALFLGTHRRIENKVGYWGASTSFINWCEKDYEYSFYIAEFFNTITNLAYIVIGARFIMQYFHTSRNPNINVISAAVCIILTGIFSGVFHATLLLEWQKADEIFENGILIFLLYESFHLSFKYAMLHFIIVAYGILFITSFLFCELHLITIVIFTIVRFTKLSTSNPTLAAYVRQCSILTLLGAISWLVDRTACEYTRINDISLQLHSFWHVFTALALDKAFLAVEELIDSTNGDKIK